jgi:hypothetical protein
VVVEHLVATEEMAAEAVAAVLTVPVATAVFCCSIRRKNGY